MSQRLALKKPLSAASLPSPGLGKLRMGLTALAFLLLASCTTPSPTAISLASAPPAAPPAATASSAGILDASVQAVTFDQIKQAIDNLYRDQPGINSFVSQGVTYKPETRDKVLKICHEGGLAGSDVERDTQKALACAPLIFFFYRYGQESAVPQSTDVARQMYWFAMTNNSAEPGKVLTNLLRSWGIN